MSFRGSVDDPLAPSLPISVSRSAPLPAQAPLSLYTCVLVADLALLEQQLADARLALAARTAIPPEPCDAAVQCDPVAYQGGAGPVLAGHAMVLALWWWAQGQVGWRRRRQQGMGQVRLASREGSGFDHAALLFVASPSSLISYLSDLISHLAFLLPAVLTCPRPLPTPLTAAGAAAPQPRRPRRPRTRRRRRLRRRHSSPSPRGGPPLPAAAPPAAAWGVA